ncbi:MAG: MurR/RpiR family transcriptional regulator [Lachnospiraceae bacterium]|uniref:MurR/RpiR family transcriptional regulator n=1 Tax=Clostridium sp. WB02_MRS01 TaxID=2605777 RepID=UPI0012B27B22|nr:MurR/RpiR family transcriptional regulator [Clostridium sp. WB02_MRS01]MBW4844839.1 MurR/RpiR family transcriptional regulator [Lachnospiraceae bacterium]MSS08386.1 MurR/RpiR family transcriptional regulator [Clostridium sp. WB02_MRS01]
MMMFSNQVLNQFSELDYEVYNFILKNSEKIPYMTIREFANEAHVSTTTITRFCRKVNCNGFSEFKIRFKMEQESTKTIRQGFDFSSILDFFQRIETESFHEQLKSIANIIAEKKQIIFLGIGNSGIIAEYASRYFCNMGIFATGINNPMFPISLEFPKESIIIILSVEGETDVLIENSEIIKQSNSTVVSVTNSKNSTLARISDYNISYYIQGERTDYKKMKVDITSQIPAVYIVEALAKLTVQRKQG